MVHFTQFTLVRAMLSLTLILFCSSLAFAQVTEEWVDIFASPEGFDDSALAMAVDGAGNVYVAGFGAIDDNDYYDWIVKKYNTDGVEQWSATHSGTGVGDDFAEAIAVDVFGNIYVTGTVNSTGTSDDIVTIKYDSDGIEQWIAVYSGAANNEDIPNGIAVDGFGNVYVVGTTWTTYANTDYLTVMYDTNGNEQWVNVYDGGGPSINNADIAQAIAVDGAGHVYVTGKSYNPAGDLDGLTIMYDSTGAQQWLARYDGVYHGNDDSRDITLDGLGNVVITGVSEITENNYECLTVKYNSSGAEQWATIYNGVEDEGASGTCIESDGSGNTYVAGSTTSSVTGVDFCTIQYDANGVMQWVSTYNGSSNSHESLTALVVDESGNAYVTGQARNVDTDRDFATVMYNDQGVEQWVAVYNGPANDYDKPLALAIDGAGNVFVAGYVFSANSNTDWVAIKYATANTSSVQTEGDNFPSPRRSLVASPNPFNPSTEVSFSLGAEARTVLSIHDVSGRLVRVLQDGNLGEGSHVMSWDGRDTKGFAMPSGIYFSRLLENGNPTATGKLTLCK